MPTIDITFTISDEKMVKLEALLLDVNEGRVNEGLPPFASVTTMLKAGTKEQAQNWIEQFESLEIEEVTDAYRAANETIRQQVKDILGV
jgi:hypothetical protein